ncbi:P-loop containing nucleoside triphosphate hydrolase protein [Vararia minispora EC-137]|uniref:P-loop containing nucleoside triphosphate hydrolase protein n=1 Tax=Vararia minispora EC-137 TaxID=1314806 RepID=A0ACB8QUC2_9AGAM|nr:P-loop containing nucleoside triphosphate hydrolase protein [Vararia minispora EC-137]
MKTRAEEGREGVNGGAERPRKRRKADVVEPKRAEHPSLSRESTLSQDSPSADGAVELDTHGPRALTPDPPSLPSFPQVTLPPAPERATLAIQGIDRALAHAQLVDPALSFSLSHVAEDDASGLSLKTRTRLKELGITELFAVQTAILPHLLPSDRQKRALYLPYDPPRDVCVSAPTGSGKTLAYVLPIIETLSTRIVTRLRALIVLPTRDLVTQVREAFEAVGKNRGLKIASATGQHSFAHEQAQLIAEKSPSLQGGSSKVDILICTPGRLMDHLHATPNFTLQHLRFLVIDEADRLLAQSFQDWLAQVLAAARPTPAPPPHTVASGLPYPDALAPAFLHLSSYTSGILTDIDEKKETSCQKLLFSATLMSDPGKIRALELRDPHYIIVQSASADKEAGVLDVVMEKFSMPATLKEHMLTCSSSIKPLMLFFLVLQRGVRNALVFTKSTESTMRLVKLFEFFEVARAAGLAPSAAADTSADISKPVVVRAYSSDLSAAERKATLEKFKKREIDLLVASDLISRGIDISHVEHVVSYDVPIDMRKYVHRVGRTARAGRDGDAWTLVEDQEARYFKEMLRNAGRFSSVARVRVSAKQLESWNGLYETALKKLKEFYARERPE